jgi:Family of unknown function (DUF6236)
MSTGTTLYYPYIHPRETSHLKAALIFWDRVRRIVPSSVTHGDHVVGDDNDAQLLVDRGLLVSTRPEPYEEAASKRFFEHVEPRSDRFRIDIETARDLASRNSGIHIEKIGGAVLQRLQNLGLAHRFGEWVSMHDKVGAFYMFCLASEMADKMSAPLLTDSPDDAAMGQALLFTPDATANLSEKLVRLGINLPSPQQLQQLPMRKIAKFARRRAVEKQEFRAAVEGILETARSQTDQNAIDDYLSSQRVRIEAAVRNLRATIDELHVGAVSATAKITVPAGAAAAIAVLPLSHPAAAILGALGLTIGAISTYAETRGKLRQAKAGTPYHYLLALEDDLKIKAVG